MIPQIPDTICNYAHRLINQMDVKSDLFKYTVHHLTYKYETSNIMGMDGVFVCMAQEYYCPVDNSKAFGLTLQNWLICVKRPKKHTHY